MAPIGVLVVAFDGLDHDLIEEFGCETLMQEEFGRIDNDTGIAERKTSELFASFITGETHEEHGVVGLTKWEKPRSGRWIDRIAPEDRVQNRRGFHRIRKILEAAFENGKRKHRREDLQADTLFEKIPDSEALFVPAYNPSWFWMVGAGLEPLNHGGSPEQVGEMYDREHDYRKRTLWTALNDDPRELLMVHFHKPDALQHCYGDRDANYDTERLEELYREMDELAGEILERMDGYDTVIFMSDHGLPEPGSWHHNTNAFYSTNRELFPDRIPHITDFHDVILERVGTDETAGLDI